MDSMQKKDVDVGGDAVRESACSTLPSPEAGGGVSARNRSRARSAVAQCGSHSIRYEDVRFFLACIAASLDVRSRSTRPQPSTSESLSRSHFFVVARASVPTLSENNRRTNHAASIAESRASTASRHLFATVR